MAQICQLKIINSSKRKIVTKKLVLSLSTSLKLRWCEWWRLCRSWRWRSKPRGDRRLHNSFGNSLGDPVPGDRRGGVQTGSSASRPCLYYQVYNPVQTSLQGAMQHCTGEHLYIFSFSVELILMFPFLNVQWLYIVKGGIDSNLSYCIICE